MNGDIRYTNNSRQTFIFHGKGLDYFFISLVNVLLSIITLGGYIPWAVVRSRRYVYENMELNGARFGYHAKGGALFISFWLMSIILFVVIYTAEMLHSLLGYIAIFLLMLIMPFFMVKSLQYNALMTTLNNIRFAFHCSMKKAWWVMMGLPTLLAILLCVVLYGIGSMMFSGYNFDSLLAKIITLALLGIVGMGVSNGYVYAKWLSLIGKGGQFGFHKFDIRVSTKYCIKACLFSLGILVPFMGLMFYLLSISNSSMAMLHTINGSEDFEPSGFPGQILLCYLLYIGGILISSAYLWQAFRNHLMNGLTLAEGRIRFTSTLTFYGVVIQLVLLVFVSGITLGLAYPWMKIRFIRYQALHTHVEGDLDDVVLRDHDEQVEKGFIALLSRGVMPIAPFI